MSKQIQEAYLKLANAVADLEDGPQCAKPEYRDWFFDEVYESGKSASQIQRERRVNEVNAKLICDFCPVKTLCAEYGIIAQEAWGIFGGLSPLDRRAIYASAKANKPEKSKDLQLFD